MINPSLILVPTSGRDSEVSITLHHPGEAFVILKTVQGQSCLSFSLPNAVLSLNPGKTKLLPIHCPAPQETS